MNEDRVKMPSAHDHGNCELCDAIGKEGQRIRDELVKAKRTATRNKYRVLPYGDNIEGETWQQFAADLDMQRMEQDATIVSLRADNLLLVKRASALRKLNIAYRLGDQKLADAALTELEALDTAQEE